MKMRPTQGVSYPRSGHTIVYHIAKAYFGDLFVYCDTNNKEYCGCEQVPCVNPDRTFSKNHDFGVKRSTGVPVLLSEHYFIQYRNPVRSIASNFYLHKQNHPSRRSKWYWKKFAGNNIVYWNRFVDKWVLNYPPEAEKPLFCSYESLLADPVAHVNEILTFLSDGPLDDEAVARVIQKLPITRRDSLAHFQFYDPGFFRELEEAASGRIERLGLPSFTEQQ